jgi:hypothetical protein
MRAGELRKLVGWTAAELKAAVGEGLPAKGTAGEIAGWLREKGRREEAERVSPWVAKTWAELARALGMRGKEPERVLQRMATRPGFPGKPSRPGKADGELPVEAIRVWLAAVGHQVDDVDDVELGKLTRRIKWLELEEKEAERLVRAERLADVEVVAQFCEQVIANSKAVLGSIEEEAVAALPESVGVNVRETVRRKVGRLVRTALAELERLAEGDTDVTDGDGD